MHKNKYYRAPKPSTLPQRQSNKPRPEWTTDFEDRSQYKLSQTEMIQKKASLQSKNRQLALQALNERRRKLQMGIVDEDTKKVYQTALTSKKIDLNPSIRRNLSQMIQYQKQKQSQLIEPNETNEQQNEEDDGDFDEEIKMTGNFIKKLQKAKKQDNIQKAIKILNPTTTSSHFGPTKKIEEKSKSIQNQDQSLSCQETLSNIEETIKFMEEKLFNPNWKKSTTSSKTKEDIQQKEPQFKKKNQNNFLHEVAEDNDAQEISYNQFLSEKANIPEINLNQNNDDEDECMSTIRRMKQMIENKSDLFCPEPSKSKQNFNSSNSQNFRGLSTIEKDLSGESEVDFSLTMNEDDVSFKPQESLQNENMHKWGKGLQNYEEVKKNLFEEIDKLQSRDSLPEDVSYNYSQEQHKYQDNEYDDFEEEKPQLCVQQKKKKGKKGIMSEQFSQIKNLLEGSKNNVQKIEVESIGISRGAKMVGFDYRGSINIKKNVSHH